MAYAAPNFTEFTVTQENCVFMCRILFTSRNVEIRKMFHLSPNGNYGYYRSDSHETYITQQNYVEILYVEVYLNLKKNYQISLKCLSGF
jgi:hypothetical protein